MNSITVEVKTVPEAPNYKTGVNDGAGFEGAKILKVIIIKNGTESGSDTIDIQFEDDNGQKYVAMTTGRLLKVIADLAHVSPLQG